MGSGTSFIVIYNFRKARIFTIWKDQSRWGRPAAEYADPLMVT